MRNDERKKMTPQVGIRHRISLRNLVCNSSFIILTSSFFVSLCLCGDIFSFSSHYWPSRDF